MTLRDALEDIHILTRDLENFERKYGVLSETFYKVYCSGEEPEDVSWVPDWAEWAGAYEALLHRRQRYQEAVGSAEKQSQTLGEVIGRAARREPLSVAA